MAKILLIETATEVCSVAIAVDGQVIALAEEPAEPKHAERLTPLIQQCAGEAALTLDQLDAVAVSRGPGSYTALRVGISTAKGICFALDKPLIAVDTLQALAAASLSAYASQAAKASPEQVVFAIPMLDARRQEVWTAVYDAQLRTVLSAQPLVLSHELFYEYARLIPNSGPDRVLVISGNGAKKMEHAGFFEKSVFSPVRYCSATHFAGIAEAVFQKKDFQEITYFEPDYMKPPNITTPNKPLF